MEKVQLPRLMIVEDDNHFATYLRDLLETLGYLVADIIATGEEAVERVPRVQPDLVLMDILLAGDMDGVAAAEMIRVRYQIPVVFVSAYADAMILQRARFTRPYGFIVKPFEKKQIYAAIEIALHNHKTERQKSEQRSWAVSALQNMADGVLVTDDFGKVQFLNAPAEELTGWSLAEAKDKEWHTVFRTYRHIPGSIADASIVTESLTPALGQYANLIRKDDSVVTIDYTMGPLYPGQITAAQVVLFRNATERNLLEQALADSRKRYKDLVNSVDGIVWEAEGENHQFSFVSKQAHQILGYSPNEWTALPDFWIQHLHPRDREWVTKFSQNVTPDQDYQIEYRMVAKDGQTVWIRDMFHADVDPDHPARYRGVLLNITEAKKAEQSLRMAHDDLERRVYERTAELTQAIAALRESEERYSLAVLGANDGLWDWNLQSGEIFYSSRWKSMLGYDDTEISNKPMEWFNKIHPEDIERVKADINGHLEVKTPQFQSEFRMLHKDGNYRWMLTRGVALRDERGTYRMAGSQTDITERKTAEEQLLHDAFYDVLTNLPNRALFLDRLTSAGARSRAHAERGKNDFFAVLFLDLDRFKVINDSLGHALGDQLLISLAKRLQSCLRPGDTVARLGGDEFTILVEDILDVRDAIKVAERIQKELQLPFRLDGRDIFTSVSIGIAISSAEYERDVDLLRDADTAMYRAKEKGKSRYEVFDKSMHGRALTLLQLETDLRRAVERNEFRIFYQPIVTLSDAKIVGFEALVRWQHPERGLLSPEEVIPIAEETGLIIPIGYAVLRDACREMNGLHKEFQITPFLSVNISGKQFSQKDLVDQLRSILEDTGFDREHLKLEITESIIMDDIEFASSLLQKLKELQVQLLIDDFGTGYSSLGYLHKFPIDTLKIDRGFVSSSEGENWEIVRTIISLAHNMGMDVIAEGVETEHQKDILLSLGCEKGQGFLFSKPLDSAGIAATLRDLADAEPPAQNLRKKAR
jgi:diguanylate cyclase (GGDEF)-like protein/PAS domain S-box-containing protein